MFFLTYRCDPRKYYHTNQSRPECNGKQERPYESSRFRVSPLDTFIPWIPHFWGKGVLTSLQYSKTLWQGCGCDKDVSWVNPKLFIAAYSDGDIKIRLKSTTHFFFCYHTQESNCLSNNNYMNNYCSHLYIEIAGAENLKQLAYHVVHLELFLCDFV